MSKRYRYRVYDHHRGDWLPGDYDAKELKEKLGFNTKWYVYAEMGTMLQKRYNIQFADGEYGEEPSQKFSQNLLDEWDKTRLKILGVRNGRIAKMDSNLA